LRRPKRLINPQFGSFSEEAFATANEREFLSIGNPVSLSVPHFLQDAQSFQAFTFCYFQKALKSKNGDFFYFRG
jgi:hypothetical protein